MLARRLLLSRKKPSKKPTNLKRLVILLVAIVCIAILVGVFGKERDTRKLLPIMDGTVSFETVEELNNTVPLPTEPIGQGAYEINFYTKGNATLPPGTTSIVYTTDKQRLLQIDYLPQQSAEEQAKSIFSLYIDEWIVTEDSTAWVVTVDNNPRCIDYEDDVPNKCEISRYILFETSERLVRMAVDGYHLTDGQLLTIAKSIIQNTDE